MSKKNDGLTWEQAILKVLTDNQRVLRYDEIAQIISNGKLRKSVGATPANTVNVVLHSENLKDKVVCVRRGEYILKEYLDNDPSLAITPANVPEEDEENEMGDALITAYGRFWSRAQWEANDKAIYGASSKTKKASSVNFSQHAGIYLLHKGYEVVYVGQAVHLKSRLDAHTVDDKRNRWDNFSWFSLESIDKEVEENGTAKSFSTEALLDTLEALLIETLGPERNKKVGNDFEDKEFEQITKIEYLQRQLGAKS